MIDWIATGLEEQLLEIGKHTPWFLVSIMLFFVLWRSTKWAGKKFNNMYDLLFHKEDGKFVEMLDTQKDFVNSVKDNNESIRKDVLLTLESIKNIEKKINQLSKIGFNNLNSDYFSVLFEHSALPTAFVDSDYNVMSGNVKFCELLGYTNDELRKLKVHDITVEEDINLDIIQAEKVKNGEIDFYRLEKTFIRKGGTKVYCVFYCYRIPTEGPFDHFIGAVVPQDRAYQI